jgi:hypothetical protein
MSQWRLSERFITIAAAVIAGGFAAWLLFLSAIGFHHDMVPSNALAQMFGQLIVIGPLDESILGIPVARFYSWAALLGGLAACGLTAYLVRQLIVNQSTSRTPPADR